MCSYNSCMRKIYMGLMYNFENIFINYYLFPYLTNLYLSKKLAAFFICTHAMPCISILHSAFYSTFGFFFPMQPFKVCKGPQFLST
jgi:hypothetical protein